MVTCQVWYVIVVLPGTGCWWRGAPAGQSFVSILHVVSLHSGVKQTTDSTPTKEGPNERLTSCIYALLLPSLAARCLLRDMISAAKRKHVCRQFICSCWSRRVLYAYRASSTWRPFALCALNDLPGVYQGTTNVIYLIWVCLQGASSSVWPVSRTRRALRLLPTFRAPAVFLCVPAASPNHHHHHQRQRTNHHVKSYDPPPLSCC